MSEHTALSLIFTGVMAQIGLCALFWKRAASIHTERFCRLINPASWVVGFYSLWFIFPQIIALFTDLHVLGFENNYESIRRDAILDTQRYCIIFLLGLNAALFAPVKIRRLAKPAYDQQRRGELVKVFYHSRILFYVLFGIGLLGAAYIAAQNIATIDGFRSQIVKTTPGKVATAMQLMGAFAFSVIFVCYYLEKKYLKVVLIVAVFGSVFMFTGARGRMLWPMMIAAMYILAIEGGEVKLKHAIYAVLGMLLLLSLDPLVRYLKFGSASIENLQTFLSPLIYKRNFDGFANFAFLIYRDEIDPSLTYLFTGVRNVFMETYFSRIYEMGVGWGVTIPGMLFLSSYNIFMFFLLSVFYGFTIALLNMWLRSNTSTLLIWSYLFAMPWYCALGGNLIESLDKLIVAASGPIIILVISSIFEKRKVRKRRVSYR